MGLVNLRRWVGVVRLDLKRANWAREWEGLLGEGKGGPTRLKLGRGRRRVDWVQGEKRERELTGEAGFQVAAKVAI